MESGRGSKGPVKLFSGFEGTDIAKSLSRARVVFFFCLLPGSTLFAHSGLCLTFFVFLSVFGLRLSCCLNLVSVY